MPRTTMRRLPTTLVPTLPLNRLHCRLDSHHHHHHRGLMCFPPIALMPPWIAGAWGEALLLLPPMRMRMLRHHCFPTCLS